MHPSQYRLSQLERVSQETHLVLGGSDRRVLLGDSIDTEPAISQTVRLTRHAASFKHLRAFISDVQVAMDASLRHMSEQTPYKSASKSLRSDAQSG